MLKITNQVKINAEIIDSVQIIDSKSKDIATSQKTLAPYTSLFDISTFSVLD